MGTQTKRGSKLTSYQFMFNTTPGDWSTRQTYLYVRALIILNDWTYEEIATHLNTLGLTTSREQAWNAAHVGYQKTGVKKFLRNEESLTRLRTRRDELAGTKVSFTPSTGKTKVTAETFTTPKRLTLKKTAEPTVATTTSTDLELADLFQQIATAPMEQTMRRNILVQIVRSIRA
jgi:hypothetical protein